MFASKRTPLVKQSELYRENKLKYFARRCVIMMKIMLAP